MGNASLQLGAAVTDQGIISVEVLFFFRGAFKAGENRRLPRAGVTIERGARKSSHRKRKPRRSQKKTVQ